MFTETLSISPVLSLCLCPILCVLSWGTAVSSSPDTSREGGKDEMTERQSGHGGDVAVMGEDEEEEVEEEIEISESRQAHMDVSQPTRH